MIKLLAVLFLFQAPFQDEDPVHVNLKADQAKYAPGDKGTITVHFEMDDPYHIYGPKEATGIPTRVAPVESKSVKWGTPEFPEPEKMDLPGIDPQDVYHHETKIKVPFTVAADASGEVTLAFQLDYMACTEEMCLPPVRGKKVEIKITVKQDDENPVSVTVKTDKESYKVGDKGTVTVRFGVESPWHIYGPKEETGIPTKVVPKAIPGIEWGEPTYPEVHELSLPGADPQQVFGDNPEVTIPFTVGKGAPESLKLEFEIDYMPCTDQMCLAPVKAMPLSVTVNVKGGSDVVTPPAAGTNPNADKSLILMLGAAFLGGLLLNIMPCVLPVLTLKLFSLVEQKDVSTADRYVAGGSYTLGALLCLNGFALAVVILRSLGNQVGWGFQFQNPWFVIVLASIVFVFALSLFGVFEIPAMGTGVAAKAGRKQGWMGHLLTGLLVTLVATPCSAPFLGTALGFAFTLPNWGIFLFFSSAGLGLAMPFLVVGFFPKIFKIFPKPGPWLEVFKKVMGFTLVLTTVWLMDTIISLTGQRGAIGFLAFLTVLSVAAWIYGQWGTVVNSTRARWISITSAILLTVVGGRLCLSTEPPVIVENTVLRTEGLKYDEKIPWQPFNAENVAKLRELKKPVFIDFTADW